jgi:hypothetical protein
MSDELERLLSGVPERIPPAPPDVTNRVADRVLGAYRRRPQSLGRIMLLAAVFLVVAGTGFTAGRWTGPTSAAADVTIGARPDTIPIRDLQRSFTLFGTISSGRPGESVQIEANECGLSGFFHELQGVRTEAQGVWSMPVPGAFPQSKVNAPIETTTKYRARWNGNVSETVTVHLRSFVELHQLLVKKKKPGKRLFWINLWGRQMKYKPRAVLERRFGDDWRTVTSLVVNRFSTTGYWLRAAKGQVLRVRLSDAEAGPCYLGNVSAPVTVR